MQIINLDKWNSTYNEIGQANPLRWQNLKHLGDGVYEPVSHKWKCKDYMNEVVTSFHLKRNFSIYGFQVNHKDFFAEGQDSLPILLHYTTPGFLDNLNVVNDFLCDSGYPPVAHFLCEQGTFIEIPTAYLANTLFMSQVTLFIRLANTEKVYQTLDEMANDPINAGDKANYAACLKKPLKDFPVELGKYIWYYNDQQNCTHEHPTDANIQTSLMHNCGVVSWGWYV